MIEQNTSKRGSIIYTHYKGIDETGEAVEYFDSSEIDVKSGLPVRWCPDETIIKRKLGKGNLKSIFTQWKKCIIYPTGEVEELKGKDASMFTSVEDRKGFIAGMGNAIMMSDANGFSYKILGYPTMPVYQTDPTKPNYGSLLTYTAEEENADPVKSGPGSYGYVEPVEPV